MESPTAEPVETSEVAALGAAASSTPTHSRARGSEEISFDEVATKLLNSNMLLTALELHFELSESGREIPRLRQFFSNPTNFEKALRVPGATERRKQPNEPRRSQPGEDMTRSSSMATLDSLELARYSDDGSELGVANNTAEERVIALEYELRKANDVIRNLREELTRVAMHRRVTSDQSDVLTRTDAAASSGTVVPQVQFDEQSDSECEEAVTQDDAEQTIMAHEKRALNFLVNEYLLSQAFKLTSITLCEENASQDFDSWDDVGLNTSRPLDLLTLYRRSAKRVGKRKRTAQAAAIGDSLQSTPVASDQQVPSELRDPSELRPETHSVLVGTDDHEDFQLPTKRICETLAAAVQVDDEEMRAQVALLESTVSRLQNELVKERQLSFLGAAPLSCRNCEDKVASARQASVDLGDQTDDDSTGLENETRTLSDMSPFQLALLRKLQPELSDWSKFESEVRLRTIFPKGSRFVFQFTFRSLMKVQCTE